MGNCVCDNSKELERTMHINVAENDGCLEDTLSFVNHSRTDSQ